jgi:hypothetical protein
MKKINYFMLLVLLASCGKGKGETTPEDLANKEDSDCRNIRSRFVDSKKVGDELVFTFEKEENEELDIYYEWNHQASRKAKGEVDGKYWKFTFADLPTTDQPKISYKCKYSVTTEVKEKFQKALEENLYQLAGEFSNKYYKIKGQCDKQNKSQLKRCETGYSNCINISTAVKETCINSAKKTCSEKKDAALKLCKEGDNNCINIATTAEGACNKTTEEACDVKKSAALQQCKVDDRKCQMIANKTEGDCIRVIHINNSNDFETLAQKAIANSKEIFIKHFGSNETNFSNHMKPYWTSFGICIDNSGKIIQCEKVKYRWNLIGVKLYKATGRFSRLIADVNGTGKKVPPDVGSTCVPIELTPFDSYNDSSALLIDLEAKIQKNSNCSAMSDYLNNPTICKKNSPPICHHGKAIAKLLKELKSIGRVYEESSPSEISQDVFTIYGKKDSLLEPYIPDNRITFSTGMVFVGLFHNPDGDQKNFQDFMIPVIAQFNISKISRIGMEWPVWNALSLDLGHGFNILDTPDPRNNDKLGKNWLFGFSLSASGISLSAGFYVFENKENENFNTTLYLGITLDLQKAAWLLKQLGFTEGQIPTLK